MTISDYFYTEMFVRCNSFCSGVRTTKREGFRAFKENQYLNREWICVSDMSRISKDEME